MSELLARLSPLPDPDPDDAFHYWDYKELNERKIVASRTDLHRKQRLFGFPAATILTGGRGANALYRVDMVKTWLAEREALGLKNNEPELKPDSRPRGRPRKIMAGESMPKTG